MQAVSESDIRSSFVNATDGEAGRASIPGLHEVLWDEREYLGWRDVRTPRRGYIVQWRDDRLVGLVLTAAESSMRAGFPAMCSLCQTQQPAHQVALFTAAKAGEAGREGNTVGTYICADLACSFTIRRTPPKSDMQPDPAETVRRRSDVLSARLRAFTDSVLAS